MISTNRSSSSAFVETGGWFVASSNSIVMVSPSSSPTTGVDFVSSATIETMAGPGFVPKSPPSSGDAEIDASDVSASSLRLADSFIVRLNAPIAGGDAPVESTNVIIRVCESNQLAV